MAMSTHKSAEIGFCAGDGTGCSPELASCGMREKNVRRRQTGEEEEGEEEGSTVNDLRCDLRRATVRAVTVQSKLGIVSPRNYLEPRTARSRAREDQVYFLVLPALDPLLQYVYRLAASRLEY